MRSHDLNLSNSGTAERKTGAVNSLVKYISEKEKWYRGEVMHDGQIAYMEVDPKSLTEDERLSASGLGASIGDMDYSADQVNDIDDDNLQARLEDLLMTRNAAASIIDEADADIEAVKQQLAKQEADRLAAEVADLKRREREALARYTQGGSIQPNYRQQSNDPIVSSTENINIQKAPSRKNRLIGIAAVSVVAVGGVGVYAATDGWKNVPFAAAFGVGSANAADNVLSAEELMAGECATDDEGKASAILTKELNVQADVLWPITLASGVVTKIEVADEKNPEATRNPYVQITADAHLYACVPDSDKKDFLKIDGKAITLDISKATPQIEIGGNKALDPVEPIALEEVKDEAGAVVVSKEVAAAAVAGAKDPANISFLTQVASAHAGTTLADPGSSSAGKVKEMFNQAKPEIITDIKAQAAALGYEDVTVEIKGEFKQDADYVGEAPKTSDKVSIDEKSLVIEPVVK